MELDNHLQDLWQSEMPPPHLTSLMHRARRHRQTWIAKRVVEALATLFVAHHYVMHTGSELGHWLFLPVALIFFPAWWILSYRNGSIARGLGGLAPAQYIQVRIEQLQSGLREARFSMWGAVILMAYAAASWWVMRVGGLAATAQTSVQPLFVISAICAILILGIAFWQRRRYRRELDICARMSHAAQDENDT